MIKKFGFLALMVVVISVLVIYKIYNRTDKVGMKESANTENLSADKFRAQKNNIDSSNGFNSISKSSLATDIYSVELSKESDLISLGDNHFKLNKGSAVFKVSGEKLRGEFTVSTVHSAVKVNGTMFNVSVLDLPGEGGVTATSVMVFDGKVTVVNSNYDEDVEQGWIFIGDGNKALAKYKFEDFVADSAGSGLAKKSSDANTAKKGKSSGDKARFKKLAETVTKQLVLDAKISREKITEGISDLLEVSNFNKLKEMAEKMGVINKKYDQLSKDIKPDDMNELLQLQEQKHQEYFKALDVNMIMKMQMAYLKMAEKKFDVFDDAGISVYSGINGALSRKDISESDLNNLSKYFADYMNTFTGLKSSKNMLQKQIKHWEAIESFFGVMETQGYVQPDIRNFFSSSSNVSMFGGGSYYRENDLPGSIEMTLNSYLQQSQDPSLKPRINVLITDVKNSSTKLQIYRRIESFVNSFGSVAEGTKNQMSEYLVGVIERMIQKENAK
ncbi:MAG: FecR domain-containing protein [Planctomycetes bacterium]|nr:FecR domain-containing protein [Planctomycetota bacterium]